MEVGNSIVESLENMEVPTISVVAAGVIVAGAVGAAAYGFYKAGYWIGTKAAKKIVARRAAKLAAQAQAVHDVDVAAAVTQVETKTPKAAK